MNDNIIGFLTNSLPGFCNVSIKEITSGIYAEGKIKLAGKDATLNIYLDEFFPMHKPKFILQPADLFGPLPHIGRDGEVCYTSDEGICLDSENPEGILTESFEMVLRTLSDGITGKNHDDLMNEVVAHFRHTDGCLEYNGNLSLTDVVKCVKKCTIKSIDRIFLGDSEIKIIEYCNKYYGFKVMESVEYDDVIYIPLKKGTMLPFKWFDSFWELQELSKVISENINRTNRKYLVKQLKKKVPNKPILIVLMVYSPNGNKVLLGFLIENIKEKGDKLLKSHPLLLTVGDSYVKPVVINRHDSEYLMPRGGVVNSAKDMKVAIVGCGSVGSYIAQEIAKAGVASISLFDDDCFNEANIYRHVLGINDVNYCDKLEQGRYSCINIPKAYGLKRSIERNLPYTTINVEMAHLGKVENIILKESVDFKEFNLVIVALGNSNVELFLNKLFHSSTGYPPVIFTWVEAYGIGGHALVTNNRGNSGCLKCLYSDETTMNNKAHFSGPNQIFAKDLSGCANMFTPYGSLDSVQTAILATRLAINVLNGNEKDNPILSWKGSTDMFFSNGYILSERYAFSTEELEKRKLLYKMKNCPICGSKVSGEK